MSNLNKAGEDKKEPHCECFSEKHCSPARKTCSAARNVTHPLRYYEFTQEEMKALEECDRESFYRRCVPLSTLFATVTYAAIKCGYVPRNPHFGAVPKVMVAVLLGYFYGRLSYMSQCDKKLRALPANSLLGNVMRKYHADNLATHQPPPKDSKNI